MRSIIAEKIVFPFTAFVGQEELKLALILLAINPRIGGVLIRGEKGTGKSALVRALADLLPPIEVVADCPFNCDPNDPTNMCDECRKRHANGEALPTKKVKMKVITLPIGATEDMVIGTLDIEKALREGIKALQPGILAKANRNILYIDEVNLLPDNIVDVILDAAASGWNFVEREGVSVSHPSRFILVGTMNPEEGELRPQLLDRFALSVTVHTIKDEDLRMEIIKRVEAFHCDPVGFYMKFESSQEEISRRILIAKQNLDKVKISYRLLAGIAKMCSKLEIDGHRADIIIAETAKTIASYNGRLYVTENDVLLASKYALGHRTRRFGSLPPPTLKEIEIAFRKALKEVRSVTDIEKDTSIPWRLKSVDTAEGKLEDKYIMSEKAKKDKYVYEKEPESKLKKEVKGRIVEKIGYVISSFARKLRIQSLVGGKGKEEIRERLSVEGPEVEGEIKPFPYGRSSKRSEKDYPSIFPYVLPGLTSPLIFGARKKHLRIRLGKNILAGRRAVSISRSPSGKYISYEIPKDSRGDIALIPTIISAILRGKKKDSGISVSKQDIRVKIRAARARALVVIVLDVSQSMRRFIRGLVKILEKLYQSAWRKRDKVALVACGGEKAKIIHFPTNNIRVIAHSIMQLKLGGRTPLADGLLKALQIVKLEKLRNPGIIPIVLLISDGLANIPLERVINPILRNELDSEAQADLIGAAQLLKKAGISLIVLNTFDIEEKMDSSRLLSPTMLLKTVARIGDGVYIGIRAVEDKVYKTVIPGFIDDETLSVIIEKAIHEAIQKIARKRL